MNVASLFINLGVKGTTKTVGQLTGAKKSMAQLGSSTLATKAMIIAAGYALNQLFKSTAKVGFGLNSMNHELGISTKELQQYQYAARQVGISNEAVSSSFKSMQQAVTSQLLGESQIAGLRLVSEATKTSGDEMNRLFNLASQGDLTPLFQKLQEYAQIEKNEGLRNQMLSSFGLSGEMIAGMSQNAFRPDVLAKAPTYSDAEIQKLKQAGAAWDNLGNKIEMAWGRFAADRGPDLIKQLEPLIGKTLELVKALDVLADKIGLFEGIGAILDFATGVTGGAAKLADAAGNKDKSFLQEAADQSFIFQWLKSKLEGTESPAFGSAIPAARDIARPQVGSPNQVSNTSNSETKNQNITINQTVNVDGGDPKKIADQLKRETSRAYRQMSAQGGF